MNKTKSMCAGCRDDYYNHGNNSTTGECWSYERAKVCTRYKIGWWTPQDRKENFSKVITLSCYSQTGQNAFYEQLPKHLAVTE